jgi:hypothetical protein
MNTGAYVPLPKLRQASLDYRVNTYINLSSVVGHMEVPTPWIRMTATKNSLLMMPRVIDPIIQPSKLTLIKAYLQLTVRTTFLTFEVS